MIENPKRIADIRAGRTTCVMRLPSEVRSGVMAVQRLYVRVMPVDADGVQIGKAEIRPVEDQLRDLRRPVRLTIMRLEDVVQSELKLKHARPAGFRTSDLMRSAWEQAHPRSEIVRLVHFVLGDLRDRDRFLQRYIWLGGDYTTSRGGSMGNWVDDVPALSEEQLDVIVHDAHQRDASRQAHASRSQGGQSLARRMGKVEDAGSDLLVLCRHEFRIIEARVERFEARLNL